VETEKCLAWKEKKKKKTGNTGGKGVEGETFTNINLPRRWHEKFITEKIYTGITGGSTGKKGKKRYRDHGGHITKPTV